MDEWIEGRKEQIKGERKEGRKKKGRKKDV